MMTKIWLYREKKVAKFSDVCWFLSPFVLDTNIQVTYWQTSLFSLCTLWWAPCVWKYLATTRLKWICDWWMNEGFLTWVYKIKLVLQSPFSSIYETGLFWRHQWLHVVYSDYFLVNFISAGYPNCKWDCESVEAFRNNSNKRPCRIAVQVQRWLRSTVGKSC